MVVGSSSISLESVYKILRSRVDVLIFYVLLFGVLYLARCDFAMDLTKEQRVCIKFCANLRKSATETLAMIRQAFREESVSSAWMFEWHAWFRAGRTSIEDDQRTGRPISCTMPDTVANLQQLVCEDQR